MKRLILISSIVLFLFSCKDKSKEPYFKAGYNYVQQTPDSLRTPEQKEFLRKLTKVVYENVVVKNNQMVFKLSEKEFIARGFPVEYYELIQKDMVNNNRFFKENNVTNVDSMFKSSHKVIMDSLQKSN